jgi:hypothetical protein
MRLFLEFSPTQGPVHQLRLTYAFRLFCAIYGHEPIVVREKAQSADACLSYRALRSTTRDRPIVVLNNLYTARPPERPAPAPTQVDFQEERTVLFYAPQPGGTPDWLAEIFEWVSCADEYSVPDRDAVGRIEFSKSYVGRHGLNVTRPYAAIAMHMLQQELCKVAPRCPPKASCPEASSEHLIVNTHDVDFLPLGRVGNVKRLVKNALISLLLNKSPRSFGRQLAQATQAFVSMHSTLHQLPKLAGEESRRSVGASFYFITANHHRRDANYRVDDPRVVKLLHSLAKQGMEVGVHGSYRSLDECGQLQHEFIRLRELGFDPRGGRQHWLRFTVDRLIQGIEQTGALYDTSLGWGHHAGFRAGACFAFPPYNFEYEGPSSFLEIPLVIMDQTLQESAKTEDQRYDLAASILRESRRYGWGGISVLWHPNAFGGAQLQPDIGRIYWKLLDERRTHSDAWTSAVNFVSTVQERYVRAGLFAPKPLSGPGPLLAAMSC